MTDRLTMTYAPDPDDLKGGTWPAVSAEVNTSVLLIAGTWQRPPLPLAGRPVSGHHDE
ncbi:hypothetical protein [Actinomadura darangshiensis]|uniref:hypothetical protein n=1 Tax=Actinomadura darangshiensis TaxID=705336 RepID=UPI0014091077|nr:hypothetical protein [Actinomadura darangshiensis]